MEAQYFQLILCLYLRFFPVVRDIPTYEPSKCLYLDRRNIKVYTFIVTISL